MAQDEHAQHGTVGPWDWRQGFTGSASAGLVCRECHALVSHRAPSPQRHLAWHDRLNHAVAERREPMT